MAQKKKSPKPLTGNAGDFSGIVLKAAARGDSVAVKQYLKTNPAWLNQEGPHGRTLLWEAAYKGRIELIKELISIGADVSPMGSYYTPMLVELSALAVARNAGNDELAELLVHHGATDDLYAACHRGDLEAIDKFLNQEPEAANQPSRVIDPPHPHMGFHPVHYAVAGKQLGSLRLLVGYDADVGAHLPLLVDWACGNREMIRYLREQAKNQGTKPIHPPRKLNSKPGVPSIDRPDWMGFPPLVEASRGNHNAPDDPARVRKILAKNANVNITDHKGKTALHRACQAGFVKITDLLIESGADLEAVDDKGCTPLFDAAHHGRCDVISMLVKRGVKIEHEENRGETPLFAAARGAKPRAFELLLKAGANLKHTNKKGKRIPEVVKAARFQNDERKELLKLIEKRM